MTEGVIHSTQHYITYINGAILANLQRRPLKFGRVKALQKTTHSFFSPHPLDFNK